MNYKVNPRKKEKIKEIGSGFGILEKHLDNWIENKIIEIEEKK